MENEKRSKLSVQSDSMQMMPYIILMEKMIKSTEPGSDKIFFTAKWHQGALQYVLTNFFPENPDFDYIVERGIVKKDRWKNILPGVEKEYSKKEVYIKLTIKRKKL